jgi:magnesium chelatase subunit D
MDRMDVMRISSEEIFQRIPKTDEELRRRIELSRKRLGDITVPEDIELYIVQTCMENGVSGHRADIFLFYAARAYAAFCGDGILGREHVDAVAPLVFAHRRRMAQQMEEMEEEQEHRHEHGDEGDSDTPPHDTRPKGKGLEEFGSADSYRIEANPKEDVFEIGTTFRTRRISFKRDRIKRLALGRRTKTISKGKGGRYVRSVMDPREKDIAIDATLRAAAPFQSFRRMDATYPTAIVIKPEDLRFKRKERRMRHIVVFVVDGSGSMGVKRRMREVKGAIQSLLVDCYQKRDRVAMIVFRRDGAELVLPPTSSVEMASKKLKDIPTGGRTPLSAGLFEAYKLIRRTYIKEKETRFAVVLVTDGRANRSISGLPIDEELERIAGILRGLSGVDYIVVDTEDKKGFLRTDLALKIASLLNAYYFRMEDLRSDLLADIARFAKRNEEGVRCAVPVD